MTIRKNSSFLCKSRTEMSSLFEDLNNIWSVNAEEAGRAAASPSSRQRGKNKRQPVEEEKVFFCAHCGRSVSYLIYTHACTYECALALAAFDSHQYDYIYTSIMAECMETRGVSMPGIAPPLHFDTITSEEYWSRAKDDLYFGRDSMVEYLCRRLRENHVSCKQDVSKRRR